MTALRRRMLLAGMFAGGLVATALLPAATVVGCARAEATPILSAAVVTATAPGAVLWTRRYDGPARGDDGATSEAISPDGSTVFVAGGSTGSSGTYDYILIAYRAGTGATRWVRRYNGPGNGYDQATAVAVSPDGSAVFVTGASRGTGSKLDYATVAYDAASGARLWVRRYRGPGGGVDYATALGVSPDGALVFVTGYSTGSGTGDDFATIAYRAASGVVTWTRRYDGPAGQNDDARGLSVSPDGSTLFVAGSSTGSASGTDFATIAYRSATGRRRWIARYDGPGHNADETEAVKVSPDGLRVFVTGESIGGSGGWDYATAAYAASNGARLWVARYDGTARRDDYPMAIDVSPDGTRVFVAGYSTGTYRLDVATVAYASQTGAQKWVARYNGPGNDTDGANALAVSPDSGTVVVTGVSIGSDGSIAWATLAYTTANGARQWLQRYTGPGPGHDYAYAVAVGPDGSRAFVTGESTAASGYLDVATRAYRL